MPTYTRVVLALLMSGTMLITHAQPASLDDSTRSRIVPLSEQRDLLDVVRKLLPFMTLKNEDTVTMPLGRTFVWLLPVVGYTLQTGFLGQIQGNVMYRRPGANASTIIPAVAYTQNNQLFFATRLNTWTPDNRFNWVGDYRLYKYPQATFGIGTSTKPTDKLNIDFTYLRVYQTLLKRVRPNTYIGIGYHLDYHWNIRTLTSQNDQAIIPNYTVGTQGQSVSSGVSFNLLYDSRMNSQNPEPSSYLNLVFRPNFRALGSDANYQSLTLEGRKYINLPSASDALLALWSYNAFTLGGNAPYLDLPSTGGDMYENSGRGYLQGRFRGRNLLYQEAEYRFPITRNRLLGGVVFVNNQIASEALTNRLGPFAPGAGVGLRLTTNKFSRLNVAIDYGFGLNDSQGIFFNFGEYF
jgi:hypothetical protein